MSKNTNPINQLVDELPSSNLTTFALNSLDFIVPGEWDNLIGWDNTLRTVTMESDPSVLQMVNDRALALYEDKSQGYRTAMWLYQTIDRTDTALGAAALANKVSEKIPLLGLVNKLTPKAEKAQAIDLSLKLVVEVVAFCQINGIPGDSIGDFVASLGEYGKEALIRMVALVCFDGLIPLGPDFLQLVTNTLGNLSPSELKSNQGFSQINDLIPGNSTEGKLNFIGQSFDAVKGWMGNMVQSHALTPQKVTQGLQKFIDVTDDKLDYLGAFLDVSTNYYEHTGTQTLARRLIERAVAEI